MMDPTLPACSSDVLPMSSSSSGSESPAFVPATPAITAALRNHSKSSGSMGSLRVDTSHNNEPSSSSAHLPHGIATASTPTQPPTPAQDLVVDSCSVVDELSPRSVRSPPPPQFLSYSVIPPPLPPPPPSTIHRGSGTPITSPSNRRAAGVLPLSMRMPHLSVSPGSHTNSPRSMMMTRLPGGVGTPTSVPSRPLPMGGIGTPVAAAAASHRPHGALVFPGSVTYDTSAVPSSSSSSRYTATSATDFILNESQSTGAIVVGNSNGVTRPPSGRLPLGGNNSGIWGTASGQPQPSPQQHFISASTANLFAELPHPPSVPTNLYKTGGSGGSNSTTPRANSSSWRTWLQDAKGSTEATDPNQVQAIAAGTGHLVSARSNSGSSSSSNGQQPVGPAPIGNPHHQQSSSSSSAYFVTSSNSNNLAVPPSRVFPGSLTHESEYVETASFANMCMTTTGLPPMKSVPSLPDTLRYNPSSNYIPSADSVVLRSVPMAISNDALIALCEASCFGCRGKFGDALVPRLLGCAHTFCEPCIRYRIYGANLRQDGEGGGADCNSGAAGGGGVGESGCSPEPEDLKAKKPTWASQMLAVMRQKFAVKPKPHAVVAVEGPPMPPTITAYVVCPRCDQSTPLDHRGTAALLVNYALSDVMPMPASCAERQRMSAFETIGVVCSVCFEIFVQRPPRLLECGHTYCEFCLHQVRRGREVLCPQCLQRTELTDAGVWGLPLNIDLDEFVQRIARALQFPLEDSPLGAITARERLRWYEELKIIQLRERYPLQHGEHSLDSTQLGAGGVGAVGSGTMPVLEGSINEEINASNPHRLLGGFALTVNMIVFFLVGLTTLYCWNDTACFPFFLSMIDWMRAKSLVSLFACLYSAQQCCRMCGLYRYCSQNGRMSQALITLVSACWGFLFVAGHVLITQRNAVNCGPKFYVMLVLLAADWTMLIMILLGAVVMV